jgi:alpha-glucosidase
VESARSRTNPKAGWYCWADGVAASAPSVTDYQKRFVVQSRKGPVVPPNNWESLFGGSAWEWVPARQQFYYHKFYKQQPDLNWRNPAVEKAMFDTMRFWLDRGVAGFRLDAIPTLFEDPQLRDEPVVAPGVNAQGDPYLNDIYTNMLPEVHGVLRRMRAMADSYPGNRVLIGETYLPNTAALRPWYGSAAGPELQLPMDMLVGFHAEGGGPSGGNVGLSATHFRNTITEVETGLDGAQPLLVFDNHDNKRSWDRFGDGVHDVAIAKIIAALLYTSRATALTYYGAEIGMATATPTRKEDVKDPIGITGWPKEKGRDGERTPMQWTPGLDAGFSTAAKTWLPIPESYKTVNVETESGEPASLLNWNERLTRLRRDVPALHDGGVVMLDRTNTNVLSYLRTAPAGAAPVVVALNMSADSQTISLDLAAAGLKGSHVKTLLTDEPSLQGATTLTNVTLPPFSAWIATVE